MKKVYIFVRRDLKMRRGKEIAQACHALERLGAPAGLPKIVCKVQSEEELRIRCAGGILISDAGCTEVPPGTLTCGAILAEVSEGELY